MIKVMTVEVREMPLTLREAETLLIVSAGGSPPGNGARLKELMVLMGRGLVQQGGSLEPERSGYGYGNAPPSQERWQATARGHAFAVAMLEKAVS